MDTPATNTDPKLQRARERHYARTSGIEPGKAKEKYHLADRTGALVDSFGTPPFSVINSRLGAWMGRRAFWKALGVDNSDGRDQSIMFSAAINAIAGKKPEGSASIFDASLCELLMSWYCPPNGLVLDPFAGGSVRGVVFNGDRTALFRHRYSLGTD